MNDIPVPPPLPTPSPAPVPPPLTVLAPARPPEELAYEKLLAARPRGERAVHAAR